MRTQSLSKSMGCFEDYIKGVALTIFIFYMQISATILKRIQLSFF